MHTTIDMASRNKTCASLGAGRNVACRWSIMDLPLISIKFLPMHIYTTKTLLRLDLLVVTNPLILVILLLHADLVFLVVNA